MPERIEWLEDGTASGAPYSPRFGDRYRAELGGISQARDVFLAGCGLPAAWSNQPQWTVLETGFGLGLNFLVTWQAWKTDSARPRMLHFVSTEAYPASAADVLRAASAHPDLLTLATQLHAQLWGLLPGFHRLVFEGGQLLLTLCIGDAKVMLKQQQFAADSVYLDGFSPQKNPDIWDINTFKAVARCCRRGTRIATWTIARPVREALAQAGFIVHKTPGVAPKRDNLQGEYNPPWSPKKPANAAAFAQRLPSTCVVIGAGLAGSAVAASLARRGWKVTVLDAAGAPASGASGLPVGLLAPHVSPDDSPLSRLSRAGVRASFQQVETLLGDGSGTTWAMTGVLEHGIEGSTRKLPANWASEFAEASSGWSAHAAAEKLAQCSLPPSEPALWHAHAGWVKPARLVAAWLKTPGITWLGNARAASLLASDHGWQVVDSSGHVLASAELIVLAAGYDSKALAASLVNAPPSPSPSPSPLALQAIRGQISWGLQQANDSSMPPFPVNGHGSMIPAVPTKSDGSGVMWVLGASFERDLASPTIKQKDHADNLARLQMLLPATAAHLSDEFGTSQVHGWAGIRCATVNRLPLVTPLAATAQGAEVWACTGMGSRGLTFSSLCAELLAARLHGEPLPVEQRLATALAHVHGKLPETQGAT